MTVCTEPWGSVEYSTVEFVYEGAKQYSWVVVKTRADYSIDAPDAWGGVEKIMEKELVIVDTLPQSKGCSKESGFELNFTGCAVEG